MKLARKPARRAVGLFGLLGQGNLGNDGSMEAVLAYLRHAHPDVSVDAICSGPAVVAEQYGIPAVPLTRVDMIRPRGAGLRGLVRRSLDLGAGMVVDTIRIAAWVRRHDSVIVPGMGILELTVPLRPWQTPYQVFVLSVSGRLLRTPIALVSVGTNVIDDRLTRWLYVTAARLAHYCSFRDVVSRDAMEAMGLDVSRRAVYPDVVFSLSTAEYEREPSAVVGVGVMDYSGGNSDRRQGEQIRSCYEAKMIRFVSWLVAGGRQVRVCTSDSADAPVVARILAGVRALHPDLDPAQLIGEPVSSIAELLRQTASVGTVVAMRFHNVLYALRLGRPTVAIGYAAKHGDLMSRMGLSRYYQDARSLDVDLLIDQFNELESRAPHVRLLIAERNFALARQVEGQFADLSAVLFATKGAAPARLAHRGRRPAGAGSETGI